MIIDAHAHIIPNEFPRNEGFPVMKAIDLETARTLIFGRTNFRARDTFFEVERRVEAMDAAGVAEEIVSPMPPLLNYSLPGPLGLSIARFVNESVAGFVADGAGRIHGLGMVPMQEPSLATAELASLADLGLRGVEVASHINGTAIGDLQFAEFFQEVDRLRLSVFVHTMPRMDEVALPPELRASIGVGIEGARGAASLAFGGIADLAALEHVLFSHAAGGLPLLLARADYFWAQQPEESRGAGPPSATARRFSYDSMVFDPRGLRFVVDYLGVDRIVLGTDFPAMPRPASLADQLDLLQLSTGERERIAYANARAFLSLGTPALDTLSA